MAAGLRTETPTRSNDARPRRDGCSQFEGVDGVGADLRSVSDDLDSAPMTDQTGTGPKLAPASILIRSGVSEGKLHSELGVWPNIPFCSLTDVWH